MEESEKLNLNFSSNLNYALLNLEKDINEANNLEDKIYLELSKDQIIEYLNYAYTNMKRWQDNCKSPKYETIIRQYKKIESIISQLELCLADYDSKFHMDGISYRRLCPQPKQKISRFVLEIFYTKHIAFNWLSSYNNYQKKINRSLGS